MSSFPFLLVDMDVESHYLLRLQVQKKKNEKKENESKAIFANSLFFLVYFAPSQMSNKKVNTSGEAWKNKSTAKSHEGLTRARTRVRWCARDVQVTGAVVVVNVNPTAVGSRSGRDDRGAGVVRLKMAQNIRRHPGWGHVRVVVAYARSRARTCKHVRRDTEGLY